MFRLGVAAVWLVIAAAACSVPPPPAPRPGTEDPAALLRSVRGQEDRVRSLRATFSARATDETGRARTVDGVLLVRKPGEFRLRLALPLGLSVFDYLKANDRTYVAFPRGSGRGAAGRADEVGETLGDLLGRHLLRRESDSCELRKTSREDVIADCRGPEGAVVRRIHIDKRSGQIREEHSYRDGELAAVFRFADHRVVREVVLPHEIVLTSPNAGSMVRVDIDRYEVNPTLRDELFHPVRP